jgi:hypothetical protein
MALCPPIPICTGLPYNLPAYMTGFLAICPPCSIYLSLSVPYSTANRTVLYLPYCLSSYSTHWSEPVYTVKKDQRYSHPERHEPTSPWKNIIFKKIISGQGEFG